MFVLGDGTRLFSSRHTILQLTSSDRLSTIVGDPQEEVVTLKDGQGIFARFNTPDCLKVDRSGNVMTVDCDKHTIHSVGKEGSVVSTLVDGKKEDDEENGDVEEGSEDETGANARFNRPQVVVVVANGDIFLTDSDNHSIRVISPQGAVHTLCDNGQSGFADTQGADARFNQSCGLALDTEENLLVSDCNNHSIRRVTMTGEVSKVAGNGEKGFSDGSGEFALQGSL